MGLTPWILTLSLLRGMDTGLSIANVRNGGVETNPFVLVNPSRTVPFAVYMGATTAGQIYLFHKLDRNHPRLARVLAGVSIGASGFAVSVNIRTRQKLR